MQFTNEKEIDDWVWRRSSSKRPDDVIRCFNNLGAVFLELTNVLKVGYCIEGEAATALVKVLETARHLDLSYWKKILVSGHVLDTKVVTDLVIAVNASSLGRDFIRWNEDLQEIYIPGGDFYLRKIYVLDETAADSLIGDLDQLVALSSGQIDWAEGYCCEILEDLLESNEIERNLIQPTFCNDTAVEALRLAKDMMEQSVCLLPGELVTYVAFRGIEQLCHDTNQSVPKIVGDVTQGLAREFEDVQRSAWAHQQVRDSLNYFGALPTDLRLAALVYLPHWIKDVPTAPIRVLTSAYEGHGWLRLSSEASEILYWLGTTSTNGDPLSDGYVNKNTSKVCSVLKGIIVNLLTDSISTVPLQRLTATNEIVKYVKDNLARPDLASLEELFKTNFRVAKIALFGPEIIQLAAELDGVCNRYV